MVTYDRIPEDAGLRRLYEWDGLTRFIAQACGRSALHRYADPLAALTINVSKDGDSFAWHFDTNDYSVTLALQMPEMGGAFEYVPDLRSPRDERYEDVQRVLDGDRGRVRILAYRPGDLVLFRGRNALHRVTPTRGARDRLVAILSYTTIPGVVGRTERSQQVYGRAGDTDRAAVVRPDALVD
jgi:predicted 2-oxoglutarate/Fe(II)-dependent dioxygenase YbiX